MARLRSALCAVPLLCAPSLMAREAGVAIDQQAMTAGDAARAIAHATGASIGFRDPALAGRRARAVKGRLTAAEALTRALAGSDLIAGEVAPGVFMISARPPRHAPPPRPQDPIPEPGPAADIVVTGAKRRIPLQSYPGSVDVIQGDTLSTGDAAHGTDAIEARDTSVSSTHQGPGRNKLFIRGIADSSFVGPTQATVGQYWNNSRLTYSAPDPDLRLYDMARVEVLQGPQGTLYGAGSLGGVLRAVPNAPDSGRPSGTVWAGATATQHGQPGADGGAMVNLPLVDDRLALRALGFAGIDGGYIDDTQRKINDINTVRTYGARGGLRWTPDSETTIDTSLLLQRIAGADSQYADAGGDGLTRASSIAQPYSNAIAQGEIAATRRLGQLDLTASVAYTTQHVFEQYEGSALSDPAQPGAPPAENAYQTAYTQDDRIHMVTGELRLARSRQDGTGWLIAASVLQNVDSIHRQMGGTDTSQVMGAQGGAVPASELTGVRNIAEEETLFGEFSFHLPDRLVLTLGGRLVRTRLAGQSLDVAPSVALGQDPNASASRIEMRALPSAALVWHGTDRLSLFARYQQSFRPGGIAVRENYIERFDSDSVKSIEAGARLTTRRLDSTLSLSWTDWKDIQADLIDGYGFPTTANIGNGRVLTLSWTGTWRPTPALRLEAGLLANDSHITDTTSLAAELLDTSIDRSRLPNVADWIGRGAAHYATQVFDLPLDLSGYARYTGKSTLGVGSVLGRTQGNYVDTGLELRLGDTRRSVSLGLTNLLDTRGNQFALGSPFLLRTRSETTPLQPRSVRLGVQVGF